jgi:hypothetical protein
MYFCNAQSVFPFRNASAALLAFLLAVAVSLPAQAQEEDEGSYPTIEFGANVMQGAQFLRATDGAIDPADEEAVFGFQRIRAGLNIGVQFHERVSATVLFEEEPNDFGTGDFAPAVDYAVFDFALNENTTFRAGTPVTGLINFRGFSDGPAVQDNPLIGNSPADMITAASGIKVIGAYEKFGYDVTFNSPTFFESFNPGQGINLIARGRVTPSEQFGFGAGVGVATADSDLTFAGGDGENYRFPSAGDGGIRNTHAALPGETIFQADAMANVSALEADAWGGYATETTPDISGYFLGLGLKVNASETFYLAARGTIVDNVSDGLPGAAGFADTSINRIQAGFGVNFLERARFKVEGVRQHEGAVSYGQIGTDWYGVLAELSVTY